MITTRKIVAVALLGASFVAGAATLHRATAPAEGPVRVSVSAQVLPNGDTLPTVTVTAKRLSTGQKFVSAFHDARDALVTRAHG